MKRPLLRLALTGLAALGIAVLAIRSAAVELAPTGPIAQRFAAGNPTATQVTAMRELLTERGILDKVTEDAAIASARRTPLDERPYVVAAVRALRLGDERAAQLLLEEARRLNPRQRLARLLLLDRYLRANAIALAGIEMAAINRLLPATGDVIAQELARLVTAPDTREAAIATLSANPALFDAVLGRLARGGLDPAALERLAGDRAPRSTEPGGWQRVSIDALVERGRYASARRQWQRTFGVTDEQARSAIFDTRFDGAAGPPFGWTFTSSEIGSVDARDGMLDIGFFGRRSGALAEQLLVLAPGGYLLGYAIEGSDGGEPGSLAVSLECVGANEPLVRLPAPKLGASIQEVATRVTVPAGNCEAQWLRIGGTAGEFSSPSNAILSRLTLVRS